MFSIVALKVAVPEHVIEPAVSDITTAELIVFPSARVAAEETLRVPVPTTLLLIFICPKVELSSVVSPMVSVPVYV